MVPISARWRRLIKVLLAIGSSNLRRFIGREHRVLPRLTTYLGLRTEAAGLALRGPVANVKQLVNAARCCFTGACARGSELFDVGQMPALLRNLCAYQYVTGIGASKHHIFVPG